MGTNRGKLNAVMLGTRFFSWCRCDKCSKNFRLRKPVNRLIRRRRRHREARLWKGEE